MKKHVAVMAAILSLAGCSTQMQNPSQTPGLTASLWELVRWPGHEIPHGDNGEPVILHFQDDGKEASVSGRAWCNRFSAPYVLRDASRLTIGHASATRMACPGKAMEFEEAFLDKLQALGRYRISSNADGSGKTLELFAVDGEVMTLQARGKNGDKGASAPGQPQK